MKRETIELKDEEEFISIAYGNKKFELMERNQEGFDGEKGMVDITFVVKRKSDNKFFFGEYTEWMIGHHEIHDLTLEEVFPEEQTITVYN